MFGIFLDVTQRKQAALHEYDRANGVRQVGNDWAGSERPGFWARHLAREKATAKKP